jgi:ubiquitin-protein ligase
MEFIKSEDIEDNILKSELFQLKNKKQSKISIDHLINIYSILYKDNIFDIYLSNKDKFCFLKSEYFNVTDINTNLVKNINNLNIDILFDCILERIKIKKIKLNNFELKDKLSLFHKSKIKSKYELNINKIKNFYSNFDFNNIETYDIPKDLLFTTDQILKLILNEILKINNDLNHDHYVIPFNNNPYELLIRFKYKDCKLGDLLKEINNKFNYDYIEIKISLNPQLYPYFPPVITYNKPKISHKLLFGILDMNILKLRNWNPIFSLDSLISELGEHFKVLFPDNLNINSKSNSLDNLEESSFERNLIDISILSKNVPDDKVNFEFNISKVNLKESSNDNKYWKSGVGYGHSGKRKWNIKEFIKNEKKSMENISNKLINIYNNLNNDNLELFLSSGVPNYMISQIHGCNLLLFDENEILYNNIFKLLFNLITFKNLDLEFINKIYNHLKNVEDEISDLVNKMGKMDDINFDKLNFYGIIDKTCKKYFEKSTLNDIFIKSNESKIDSYKSMVKKYQDEYFKSEYKIKENHKYFKKKSDSIPQKTLLRIMSEISILKSLPREWDASILINYSKDNINLMTSIVTGPKDTPYHNGLFEFHIYFPDTYPKNPPKVLIETNGNGKVRFNPNLYAGEGKVCLSLLGTWSGEGAEVWNNKSTSLQVLNSIQSLILVDEPYFNEPGWEKQMNTESGKRKCFDYKDNIRLQTIRWAINNQIKNPPYGFEGFVKEHFIAKKDELIEVTKIWVEESKRHKSDMDEERNKMIKLLSELDSEIEINLSLSDKKKSADSEDKKVSADSEDKKVSANSEVSSEELPPPYSTFVIGDELICKDIWHVKEKKVEKWRKGKVIDYDKEKGWKIHFIGWKDKWDTYIKNEEIVDRIKQLPNNKKDSNLSEEKEGKKLELDDFNEEVKKFKIKIKKFDNFNNLKFNIGSSIQKYSTVELKLKDGKEYYIKAKMNLFPEYKDYEFKNGFKGIGYYKSKNFNI